MNKIRKEILNDVDNSVRNYPWEEHRDLASFCVCCEWFDDPDGIEDADFNEILAIVDKDWLYDYMIRGGIENPRDFLINEYTSYDSFHWFQEAAATGHLAVITFN